MKINEILSGNAPTFLKDYGILTQSFLGQLVDSAAELEGIQASEDFKAEGQLINDTIEFIEKAKHTNAKLMICGDYDCDGITSTAMLIHLLEKVGFTLEENIGYYIPNRLKEGYGVSVKIVEAAIARGYTHFILIDNGVKAHEAIDVIQKHGASLLVMDHHTIEKPLSHGLLYHPDLLDPYFESLCSAGLVYVLANAMNLVDDFLLILGAIGTIGDMMPLRKQNRVLVKKGLQVLNSRPPKVISSLLKRRPVAYDETLVSFQIVPVFNAVGRLSDVANVNQVVKYLLLNDESSIQLFAQSMLDLNETRKKLSKEMGNEASLLITEHPFQVIYQENFHEGLVGIIAGQIARATSKPTLVLTQNGSQIKGSARSQHFDVYSFLSRFSDFFDSFGGHRQACALSLPLENFSSFRDSVNEHMREVVLEEPSMDALVIDPEAFTVSGYQELMNFAPFGIGFEMMDVLLDVKVISEIPLNQSGIKWKIEPIGEIQEVVYFGANHTLLMGMDSFRVVGKLQKGYRDGLTLNASYIDSII